MDRCDVAIVGGGPAGAACAWALCRGGLDVVVLDKAHFPRHKVCAGWITPTVLAELDIDGNDYGRGRVLQPITGFRAGLIGARSEHVDYGRVVSFGIRRCEFDDFLLRRAGARLELGASASRFERHGADGWVIDGRLRMPVLVGAGGHFCPVARMLGADTNPKDHVVFAQEIEFEMNARQGAECRIESTVPELSFCDDLKGYGWCFHKGNFLNVGLGREDRDDLPRHVADFRDLLIRQGRIPSDLPGPFQGHAYLLNELSTRVIVGDGVLLVGDSAGLAYARSGEGIRPAIESGLIAAQCILEADGRYGRSRLEPYRERIGQRFGTRAVHSGVSSRMPTALKRRIAGVLLTNRWFMRHVLLDRWFLHAHEPPLRQSAPPDRTASTSA